MNIILRWIINALILLLIGYYMPGISVRGFGAALVAALILGLVNAIIRPLILLLTLPVNILTLGLFTLVINALMFLLASYIAKGFNVAGFWPAFWGALIMTLLNWIVTKLIA